MLVSRKAPLYARDRPPRVSPSTFASLSIFWSKRRRMDPIGTSGHETQRFGGSGAT
jgi:hypothetical protein